jgi:hypothetical protein
MDIRLEKLIRELGYMHYQYIGVRAMGTVHVFHCMDGDDRMKYVELQSSTGFKAGETVSVNTYELRWLGTAVMP